MDETEPASGRGLQSVSVPDHVSWYDAGLDLVVFNGRDGTYHALDRVGSDIWRAITREVHDLRWFVDRAERLGLLITAEQ